MADDRQELQENQYRGGQNSAEVQEDTDVAAEVPVIEAFSWKGLCFILVLWAEYAVEVEVHCSGETEPEKCTSTDKP